MSGSKSIMSIFVLDQQFPHHLRHYLQKLLSAQTRSDQLQPLSPHNNCLAEFSFTYISTC